MIAFANTLLCAHGARRLQLPESFIAASGAAGAWRLHGGCTRLTPRCCVHCSYKIAQTRDQNTPITDSADMHPGVAQHAQRRRAARRQPRVQQLRDQPGVEDERQACGGETT